MLIKLEVKVIVNEFDLSKIETNKDFRNNNRAIESLVPKFWFKSLDLVIYSKPKSLNARLFIK